MGMMVRKAFMFLFSVGIIIAWTACRAPKQIQTAISKVDSGQVIPIDQPAVDSAVMRTSIFEKVSATKIDFDFFSAKIKVDYTDNNGKNTNANAQIRLRKDSLMWISLTGALGIEGFRVLVSPDSVVVMDKLAKTISRRSVSYLQEVVKLPIDFYVLQDMIIGNPVFFANNIVSYKYSGPSLMALSVGDFFKHIVTLDTASNLILHSKIDDVDGLRNRTCDITLSGYVTQQDRAFSTLREITVTEKSKLDIQLDFKQFVFNEPASFPFNIPKNYIAK